MIRAFQTVLLALLVALVPMRSASTAAARPAQAGAGPVQFVVGTYSLAGRSTLGTLWGWHTSAAADVSGLGLATIALHGPSGWNDNAPSHGCAVFNGMAPTNCIGWQGIPVLPGQYTAQGSTGSWFATATTSSSIKPPHITKVEASGTSVSLAWSPVAGAQSYVLAVTTAKSRTCCDLQNQVVPPTSRSYVLTNVAMTKGQRYRVAVFALSADVMKDIPLSEPFEVGEGRMTVVAGAASVSGGGVALGPSIKAQVHGSALVGGSSAKIVDLRVEGLPAHTTVVFRCLKGCSVSENVAGSGVVHSQTLRGVTVPNGAVIEIRATKAGYTGFYDRLTIHANAVTFFTETKMCLPPGGTSPHVCKNGR